MSIKLVNFFSRWISRARKIETSLSLPEGRLRELLSAIEPGEIKARLPDLSGKMALEISPHLPSLVHLLKEKGATLLHTLGVMEEPTVRGRLDSLPFLDNSFSFILCRLSFARKDQTKLLQELGRLISTSGKLLLTDLHPYSQLVQEEFRRNPALEEGLPPSIERYMKVLVAGGFKIESIREVFLDATIKKTFGEKGRGDYERLRRSPFLLLMVFTKGR